MIKNGIEIKPYVREKKGLYYVVLVYKNAAGKRRDKSFPTKLPVKGNKKKAEAMAKEILENFEIPLEDLYLEYLTEGKAENALSNVGTVIPPELLEKVSLADLTKEQVSNMLFADYMVKYLPIVRMRQIEESTYSGYVGNVRNPIGPYFREKKITLSKLTAEDIQDFYSIQLQRVKGSTVIHYHTIIRLALCYARKKGYIKENPIEEVEKPEIEHYVAKVLSASELNKAIEITKGTKLEFPVIFAGVYGLRRSEIVGLRWSSIDFENNIVFINHKVVTPKVDGVVQILAKDKGKSDSSNRALPLDKDTKARLLAHKEKQEMYQKKFKSAYSKKWLDYVMVDELGELILPNYIIGAFNRMVENNGLKDVRFHDLRHTCASLLLNHGKLNGISMKDIQVWLGHSDFATTANIYSHVDASSKQASMETISGLVNI